MGKDLTIKTIFEFAPKECGLMVYVIIKLIRIKNFKTKQEMLQILEDT